MTAQTALSGLRALARGTGVTLLLRMAAGGIEFLLNLQIARLFGASGAGAFYLALTVMTMTSVIARLGLDNSLLRLTAADAAVGAWSRVRSCARRGLGAALGMSLALSLLLFAASLKAAELYPEYGEAMTALRYMIWAAAPVSAAYLLGEVFKSVSRFAASQTTAGVLIPLLTLIALTLTGGSVSIVIAAAIYSAAAVMAALAGAYWWHRALASRPSGEEQVSWRELFQGTGSLLWIKSARMGVPWIATLVLALTSTQEQLGVYHVALRVSLGLGLLLIAVNSVASPRFSALFRHGTREQLETLACQATRLSLVAAAPIFVLFLAAPGWVMHWFGETFREEGAAVLLVLTAGQAISVLTGPVNSLLMMSGHERSLRHCLTLSIVAGGATIAVLTPSLGAVGAAIGTAVAMSLQNIAASCCVWSRLRIVTIPFAKRPASVAPWRR